MGIAPAIPGNSNGMLMVQSRIIDLELLLIQDEFHRLFLVDGNKEFLYILFIVRIAAKSTVQALVLGVITAEHGNKLF